MKVFIMHELGEQKGTLNGTIRCLRELPFKPKVYIISPRDVEILERTNAKDVDDLVKMHFSVEEYLRLGAK